MTDPSWATEARSELGKASKEYNAALKSIALGIAIGERSERVLARHVRDAFRVLAISGNARKPWYARHELEVALGGGSSTVPDFISGFFPDDSHWKRVVVCVLMLLMLIIGAFLIVHGFLQVHSAIYWTWFQTPPRATSVSAEQRIEACSLNVEPTPISVPADGERSF